MVILKTTLCPFYFLFWVRNENWGTFPSYNYQVRMCKHILIYTTKWLLSDSETFQDFLVSGPKLWGTLSLRAAWQKHCEQRKETGTNFLPVQEAQVQAGRSPGAWPGGRGSSGPSWPFLSSSLSLFPWGRWSPGWEPHSGASSVTSLFWAYSIALPVTLGLRPAACES